MCRQLTLPIMILSVAGCAAGTPGPGTLPKDAASGIYTTADANTVASCIANAIGSTAEPVGDRLIVRSVRSPGVSYSVGHNDRDGVYATQVAIIGTTSPTADSKEVDRCSVSPATKAE